eukprot:TRINITY_DN14532_c0_g1_i1.p2 TRINITY_DN14532_c0_g1~~TRINITY_DN14532_c0_g1_i1.p2  ORF type:complete len:185 (+),score=11.78 TRINITY_DN14532_c0_g1_i1:958-1512(+)
MGDLLSHSVMIVFETQSTVTKFLTHSGGKRSIRPVIHLAVLATLFVALFMNFEVYRWWVLYALNGSKLATTFDVIMIFHDFIFRFVKQRRFVSLVLSIPFILILCLTPWQHFHSTFNITSYLIHICFVMLTFLCRRALIRIFYQLATPLVFSKSKSKQKWINWSSSTKWFFVMLVMLPTWSRVR